MQLCKVNAMLAVWVAGLAVLVTAEPTSSTTSSAAATSEATTATTTATTTYPTTITSIWSTTITSFPTINNSSSSSSHNSSRKTPVATATAAPTESWVTARTVTLIEPWPVSPDPAFFPYTMVQTSIVRETATHEMKGVAPSTSPAATTTAYPTWVLWDTQGADLPVGIVPRCESLSDDDSSSTNATASGTCAPTAWKPETRCLALGLETRCKAQCIIRDWQWWCLKGIDEKDAANNHDSLPMGRLCWGSRSNCTQLIEPCDASDYPPECAPCPVVQNM